MKPYMNFKCCKNCTNRPKNPRKACEFGWHVFGSSEERSMCIFLQQEVKDGKIVERKD